MIQLPIGFHVRCTATVPAASFSGVRSAGLPAQSTLWGTALASNAGIPRASSGFHRSLTIEFDHMARTFAAAHSKLTLHRGDNKRPFKLMQDRLRLRGPVRLVGVAVPCTARPLRKQ